MPNIDLLPEQQAAPGRSDEWTVAHRMAVALHLAGFKPPEIAERMQVTPAFVGRTLTDPRAKHEVGNALAQFNVSVTAQLEHYAAEAFNEALDIMRTTADEKVKLKAAFGIMDRAGFSPIKRVITAEVKLPANAGLLQIMQETLAHSAQHEIAYDLDESNSYRPIPTTTPPDPDSTKESEGQPG